MHSKINDQFKLTKNMIDKSNYMISDFQEEFRHSFQKDNSMINEEIRTLLRQPNKYQRQHSEFEISARSPKENLKKDKYSCYNFCCKKK